MMHLEKIELDKFPEFIQLDGIGVSRSVYFNGTLIDPKSSVKVFKHSVEFNWGYGGSGPAQLALAVLLEATNDPQQALYLYQQFKRKFVCAFPESFRAVIKLNSWAAAIKSGMTDEEINVLEFMELSNPNFEQIRIKTVGTMSRGEIDI